MKTTIDSSGKKTEATEADLKKIRDVREMALHCLDNVPKLADRGRLSVQGLDGILEFFSKSAPAVAEGTREAS